MIGKILIFSNFNIFCNDCPEIKETYPGIRGNTHGDKKLISPAPKAINNSNIILYFSLQQRYLQ